VNQRTPVQSGVLIAFACVYFFWGSTYVAIRFDWNDANVDPIALHGVCPIEAEKHGLELHSYVRMVVHRALLTEEKTA